MPKTQNTTALEKVQAAVQKVEQAEAALQQQRHLTREARREANRVFALAQQPPTVEGAVAARMELTEIERKVALLENKIPDLTKALEQARRDARQAGLTLMPETAALLLECETRFRDMRPLIDLLDQHTDAARGSRTPQPGQALGRHDPYHQLPSYLQQLKGQLDFIDQKRTAQKRMLA